MQFLETNTAQIYYYKQIFMCLFINLVVHLFI